MSDNATRKLKGVARHLLACEEAASKLSGAKAPSFFRVCEKLRGPLGKLMGIGGFRSLLSRALAIASAEVPWLRTVQIKDDGSVGDMDDTLDPRVSGEGEVALSAQLLALLMTFIGPALTVQLMQEVWPKENFDDLNF